MTDLVRKSRPKNVLSTITIPESGLYDSGWGRDQLLGKVALEAARIFPNGFEGSLPLSDAGKGGEEATLTVKVEVLKSEDEGTDDTDSDSDSSPS